MASRWGRTFRYANGDPIVGKGNNYFEIKGKGDASAYEYYMTESNTMKGYYYCDVEITGQYDVYIDGLKDDDLSGTTGLTIYIG